MGRSISILIVIITLFSAALDAGQNVESHDSLGAASSSAQSMSVQSKSTYKTAETNEGDKIAEKASASNQAHDCHLGHCSFEIKTVDAVANITASDSAIIRPDSSLPDAPTSAIPRPPRC